MALHEKRKHSRRRKQVPTDPALPQRYMGLDHAFADTINVKPFARATSPESKLATAVLMDAINIIQTGKVGCVPDRNKPHGKAHCYQEYLQALWYVFDDPDPGRVMGFEWCLEVASQISGQPLNPDAVRTQIKEQRSGRNEYEKYIRQGLAPEDLFAGRRRKPLSDNQIFQIRKLGEEGIPRRDIAEKFGIDYSSCRKIVAGLIYK